MTSTLRKWFKEAKVDWDTLVVLIHTVDASVFPDVYGGWSHSTRDVVKFKYTDIFDVSDNQHHKVKTVIDTRSLVVPSYVVSPVSDLNSLLDYECDTLGPKFAAEDKDRIYYVDEYDGYTSIAFVYKDLNKYFDINEMP